jgi:NADH-quinone oxidoreductase subunit A
VNSPESHLAPLWPLGLYFGLVIATAVGMIGASYVLGGRSREYRSPGPYEGGILGAGWARLRMSTTFYLVAMFFVVFDLESAFIYAWAVAIREAGWAGYIEMCIFVAVLVAGLAYLWRLGGFEQALLLWGRKADRRA